MAVAVVGVRTYLVTDEWWLAELQGEHGLADVQQPTPDIYSSLSLTTEDEQRRSDRVVHLRR
jgi:hypothetical protein